MSSYKEIIKTSGMIGGSQIITILVGIIKTKIFALFLGPSGVGLFGMFSSISDVVRVSTGFGLNVSGVRAMAQAKGADDNREVARIRVILVRLAFLSGIIGTLCTLIFSRELSYFTFKNYDYVNQIRILSVSMFFTALSGMQTCLMQGLREIKMMVSTSLCTCIVCAIVSVFLVYVWRFESIIWVIITNAIITWIINRIFFLKIKFEKTDVSYKETFEKGRKIVKLGLFLISVDIFTTVVMYVLRSFIVDQGSLDDLGIFQASWTLSMQYVGLVMGAMMTDFFPRLAQSIKDVDKTNTLLNEQTLVCLLIGSVVVTCMLAFLPLIIMLLNSTKFVANLLLYQLMVLGVAPRIISYPMGYLLLSLEKGSVYIFFSGIFYLLLIISVYLLWPVFGFVSIGLGFCSSAYVSLIINFFILLKTFPLKYTNSCLILMLTTFAFVFLIFFIQVFLSGFMNYLLTGILFICLGIVEYSYYKKIKTHRI